MLLCNLCWYDSTIIAAGIEFLGVLVTAIVSISIVFCQINKQKQEEIKNHKRQVLTKCSASLIASLDVVSLQFRIFSMKQESEKELQWSKLQEDTLPYMYEATRSYEEIELTITDKNIKQKMEALQKEFIDMTQKVAKDISVSDATQYEMKSKELEDAIRGYLDKLNK